MIDLDAIEKRCDAAMKGPWSVGRYGIGEWEVIPVARGQYWGIFADRADAEFIACARDDIPVLVAEVVRLRKALTKWIHKCRAEVATALTARNEVESTIVEWYDECQSEVERLRKALEQDEDEDEEKGTGG